MCGLRRGRTASDISIYFYLIYLYSSTGIRHGSIGGVRAATDRAMSELGSVVPDVLSELGSVVPDVLSELGSVVPDVLSELGSVDVVAL